MGICWAGRVAVVAVLASALGGCSGGQSAQTRPRGTSGVAPIAGPSTIVIAPADAERFRSAVEVGKLREEAIDLLRSSTQEQYALARATALEGLLPVAGRLSDVIPPLLRDGNAGVRSAAAMVVGRGQLRGLVSEVEPLVSDGDLRVRASALYAMDACGLKPDLTPMAAMLLGDDNPRVRAHAAFLLGEMKDASALGLLRDAARQPVPRASVSEVRLLQLQIAEAMVKLGDNSQLEVIRAALYPARPEDLEAAALAVQIIGQVNDRGAMDNLIYLTATRDEQGNPMPAEIRLGAAGALARMGLGQGTFIADEFAGHPQSSLRAQAASVYGEIGRTENIAKLAVLMRDSDPAVRVSAAAAVVKVTGRR